MSLNDEVIQNKGFKWVLLCLLFSLINLPKIDLLPIPGMSQGIRIDDIIVLLVVSIFIFSNKIKKTTPKIVIYILLYLIFSSVLGIIFHPGEDFIRLAYIFRVTEYILFAIALKSMAKYIMFNKLCIATLSIQFVIVTVDFLLGSERSSGTLAGPWEVVTVTSLFALFALHYNNGQVFKYFLIPIIISILTKSRTSILGVFSALLLSRENFFKSLTIFLIPISMFFIYLFGFSGADEFEWLKAVFNPGNIDLIYGFVDTAINGANVNIFQTYKDTADPSLAMRMGIWFDLISLFSESEYIFLKYLFGIGLGSKSIVVDGFYIRLVFELGLIGVIIYFNIMLKLWRVNTLKPLVVLISFTCLTLDPYSSSKIAYTIGILYAKYKRK